MLTFADPVATDLIFLANNLRDADALEVDVHRHERESRHVRILLSVDKSRGCLVVRDNDVPICIFGIVDGEEVATGVPWMLGTDGLLKHSTKVARWGKMFVEAMQREYVMLHNIVYAGNTVSQRWLEWMGFIVVKDKALDVSGEPFYLFYRLGE